MDADSPSLKQPVSVAHLSPLSGTVDLRDSLENEEGGPRSPQDRVGADIGGTILTFPQPRPAGGGGEMKGSDKPPATQPHPSPRHLGAGGGVNGLLCASELKAIRCYLSEGDLSYPCKCASHPLLLLSYKCCPALLNLRQTPCPHPAWPCPAHAAPAPTVCPAEDPEPGLHFCSEADPERSPRPGMPPSSDLPGGQKPTSSFGSVDWLSQSSHVEPAHTSRPTVVSWSSLSAPARASSGGQPPQAVGMEEAKPSAVSTPGTSTTGLSKEADSPRPPRVRTAFTEEQVSTLESSFQLHRYLDPQERRRLAQTMGLSEVQIKTWFQNRRMKHKRQLQDSQLNVSLSGGVFSPLAFCPPALGSPLQLLHPWASLSGPSALAQPPGSFWDPCQGEQASLASAWASSSRQPLMCCLRDPGSQAHTLGPALSRGAWRLCVLPETGDAF